MRGFASRGVAAQKSCGLDGKPKAFRTGGGTAATQSPRFFAMYPKRFNWPILTGFLLSLFAFISYFLIFVWFPTTRNFPWANLLLFVVATALLLLGLRRAFTEERRKRSKVFASIITTFGVLVFALFAFNFFVFARWIPSSKGAPTSWSEGARFHPQRYQSQTSFSYRTAIDTNKR